MKQIGKWIVYAVLGLVAILLAIRLFMNGIKYLANFTHWAKRLLAWLQAWWDSLFSWTEFKSTGIVQEREERIEKPAVPFSAFSNPFDYGDGRSAEELVRYSFEALEALASDHEQARQPDETPLEFADRLKDELADLRPAARKVAQLYARVVYARSSVPRSAVDQLREFWESADSRRLSVIG